MFLNSISKITNLSYADVLNKLIIDKDKDKFGQDKDHTVSSVLSGAKENDNLTPSGQKFAYIINMLMPDHI